MFQSSQRELLQFVDLILHTQPTQTNQNVPLHPLLRRHLFLNPCLICNFWNQHSAIRLSRPGDKVALSHARGPTEFNLWQPQLVIKAANGIGQMVGKAKPKFQFISNSSCWNQKTYLDKTWHLTNAAQQLSCPSGTWWDRHLDYPPPAQGS